MAPQMIQQLNFTAGELTPWLSSRVDVEMRSKGVSLLQNFLVTPFGGVKRRSGAAKLGHLTYPKGHQVRLWTFDHSTDAQFMLVLSPYKVEIFDPSFKSMLDQPLVTPWGNEDIPLLNFQQLNDVLYCVCPHHPPQTISRYANNDWRIAPVQFSQIPYEGLYRHDARLNFQYEKSIGADIFFRVTSSESIFDPSMVQSEIFQAIRFQGEVIYKIPLPEPQTISSLNRNFYVGNSFAISLGNGYKRGYECIARFDPAIHYIPGNDNPASYPNFFSLGVSVYSFIRVVDSWSLSTRGTWSADFVLYQGNVLSGELTTQPVIDWHAIKRFEQNTDKQTNYNLSGKVDGLTYLTLRIEKWNDFSAATKLVEIKIDAAEESVSLAVTEYVSDREVMMRSYSYSNYTMLFESFQTNCWSYSAFGQKNGYPHTVAFYQGRLWFGCTQGQPQTLWASALDDFGDFKVTGDPQSALCLTLAASEQNQICWLSTLRGLVVGTNEGEWRLKSSDSQAINLNNASFERQSGIGSASMRAIGIENTVYFVQKGNHKIHELYYSLEYDGFATRDVSLSAEHLFSAALSDWCYQKNICSYLWGLHEDGALSSLTVNRENGITGWHRHKLNIPGHIKAIASIQRLNQAYEDVWLLMRTGGDDFEDVYDIFALRDENVYLDGYVEGTPQDGMIGNLLHLAHQEVSAVAGDVLLKRQVDEYGYILIPNELSDRSFIVGAPFESQLVTMPLESYESMGRLKNQIKADILLYESTAEFEYGNHGESREQFDSSRHMIRSPYSGYVPLLHNHGTNKRPQLSISCQHLGAFNLQAIIAYI